MGSGSACYIMKLVGSHILESSKKVKDESFLNACLGVGPSAFLTYITSFSACLQYKI